MVKQPVFFVSLYSKSRIALPNRTAQQNNQVVLTRQPNLAGFFLGNGFFYQQPFKFAVWQRKLEDQQRSKNPIIYLLKFN